MDFTKDEGKDGRLFRVDKFSGFSDVRASSVDGRVDQFHTTNDRMTDTVMMAGKVTALNSVNRHQMVVALE
jgi:hypothetical protein